MNKGLALLVGSILVGGSCALVARSSDPQPPPQPRRPPASQPAPSQPAPSQPAPSPQGCVAGCDAADDRPTPLEPQAFDELLARFASESPEPGSVALETLLFHHRSAAALLASSGPGPLDPERSAFLQRELARERAWLDLRVVDLDGALRVRLGRRSVPLGVKQHLRPEQRERLQPLEISGTVRRVGLYHLWSRI